MLCKGFCTASTFTILKKISKEFRDLNIKINVPNVVCKASSVQHNRTTIRRSTEKILLAIFSARNCQLGDKIKCKHFFVKASAPENIPKKR